LKTDTGASPSGSNPSPPPRQVLTAQNGHVGIAGKLTRRANEIADLVAEGLTNREIAGRLFISRRTVDWHVEQIFNTLGFSSRSQIAAWVGRSQIEPPSAERHIRPRGNLPAQFTSFVGRDIDTSTVTKLIQDHRLVTVTGPGGTGKTRLAVRVAEGMLPEFPDGAWFCDLARVSDGAFVGDALAHALGLNRAAPDRLHAVREHLRERAALLVVDNCEHLVATVAAVARDVLQACHDVRLLSTSRMPLVVPGEAVYRLKPLDQDDAIRLFKERAEAATPGFRIDDVNARSVAAICQHLDGVPLAIELVVPRLRVQTATELATAVLDLSREVRSDERHGSLRSLAQWSYRLLQPEQQALFRCLGAFASWFDAEDAAAVAPSGSRVPVLLSALVEQSMLVYEQTAGSGRYRLIETLRMFALEELANKGDQKAVLKAHAERIVSLAERLDIILDQGPATSRPKVAAMVDDVRAALALLLDVNPRRAAWLCVAMAETWAGTGRALEALHWSERALEANPDPSLERCWNLISHSTLLALLGRNRDAIFWLAQADVLADALKDADLRARTKLARARSRDALGDHQGALDLCDEVIRAFSRNGDEHPLAVALNHMAMNLLFLGRYSEACEAAQRAVEIFRGANPDRLVHATDTLAQALAFLGDLDQAKQRWIEVCESTNNLGWGYDMFIHTGLFGLALVAGLRGKNQLALRLHYCAERTMATGGGYFVEPITWMETEVIARLEAEAGPEVVATLRVEGEALTLTSAVLLAKADA
jgi:predicted ATPase/DNA-binding CsgD family transcriptional regulator